jgi:hypothetical protein
MGIFIIYIVVIRPLSPFDSTNFKVSFVIKVINFNENFQISHLAIFVIFLVNVITCQVFNLPYIYCIFVKKKLFFFNEIFQISHMVSKHGSNYVK